MQVFECPGVHQPNALDKKRDIITVFTKSGHNTCRLDMPGRLLPRVKTAGQLGDAVLLESGHDSINYPGLRVSPVC